MHLYHNKVLNKIIFKSAALEQNMLGRKGESTPAHTKHASRTSHAGIPIIKGLKNTLLQQHILTNINDDMEETVGSILSHLSFLTTSA